MDDSFVFYTVIISFCSTSWYYLQYSIPVSLYPPCHGVQNLRIIYMNNDHSDQSYQSHSYHSNQLPQLPQ